MIQRTFSPGLMPDVVSLSGRTWCVYSLVGGGGLVAWSWPDGSPDQADMRLLDPRCKTHGFARATIYKGRPAVAYRIDVEPAASIVAAYLDTGEPIPEFTSQPCAGNSPCCWSLGRLVIQSRGPLNGPPTYRILIDGQETDQFGFPDGVSHLDSSGRAVFCKDIRTEKDRAENGVVLLPGLLEPVWAATGRAVVGMGPSGGVAAQLDGQAGVLLPGQITNSPRVCQQIDGKYTVCYYDAEAVKVLTDVTAADLQAPPIEILPINRALWTGWFQFLPAVLPGNCRLYVGPGTDGIVRSGQQTICRYAAAANDSDVDELEMRIREAAQINPSIPVLPYWTRQAQTVRVPRGADLIGVEAYCGVDESLTAFEQRVTAAVRRCERPWLIAQCYTSNLSLTTDLRALVPIYGRLLRDLPQIEGILIFSGSGRPTGLQDHPEVEPLWRELLSTIQTPTLTVPIPAPKPVPVPKPKPIPISPIDEVAMPKPGSTGAFRAFGSTNTWTRAEVITHQDAGIIPGCVGIAVHDGNPDGDILHWGPDGQNDGRRHAAGGEERAKFDGNNLLISIPGYSNNPFAVYEWVNL